MTWPEPLASRRPGGKPAASLHGRGQCCRAAGRSLGVIGSCVGRVGVGVGAKSSLQEPLTTSGRRLFAIGPSCNSWPANQRQASAAC